MRDLVRESGLPRETIHFYKLQGLLPEPVKTGRNTALYTQEHVERLHRIRELQERQFLPLKAIRAILEDTYEEGFTPDQEDLVRQVRASLAGWTGAQQRPSVPVADLVPGRVSRRELRELVDAGLVAVHGSGSGARVSEDDAVILECWAQFKEAGLGPDRVETQVQQAGTAGCPGHDRAAHRHADRTRLAGQHRDIDRAGTVHHHAIARHDLPGPDLDQVADRQFLDRDLVAVVTAHPPGGQRQEMGQTAGGASDPAARLHHGQAGGQQQVFDQVVQAVGVAHPVCA
jgi:DNA-binding transcriptional MerR regulator